MLLFSEKESEEISVHRNLGTILSSHSVFTSLLSVQLPVDLPMLILLYINIIIRQAYNKVSLDLNITISYNGR